MTSGFRFGEPIRFELTIRNNTGSAQEIDLPTGQVYDFVVLNPGAQGSRWKWSTNRAFTQATIKVDFAPNESRTYPLVWNGVLDDGTQIMPGTYDARGLLAYMGYSSALRASDELASPLRTFTIAN